MKQRFIDGCKVFFMQNKKISALFAGFLLGVVLFGGIAYLFSQNPLEHNIVLTDNGFSPDEITIKLGDTVTFVNERAEPFWPASDIHPTHEIYSEFDPQKPLPPGSSWSFTFTQPGEWKFHDHVAPLFVGAVTVLDGRNKEHFISNCNEVIEYSERLKCWDEDLQDAYEVGGIEQGFNAFADLFNSEFEFAQECHSFTHTLGNMAYKDYTAGKDFEVTPQVAYCSYGFFHGFMESLAFETGDYKGSREFCDYIEESLGGQISSVGPCIHGIGHGVSDAADPRVYGKPEKLIETGLSLCADLSRTEYEEKICATGVYNALSEYYLAGLHGFTYNPEDPYAICRDQTRAHIREACYEDLKTLVLDLGNNDLAKAVLYVIDIEDDMRYRKQAMENLALYHVYDILADDYAYSVETCQALEEHELRISCIRGLSAGFINSGTPDKEYVRALDFCASDVLEDDDQLQCYDRMLFAAFGRYPSDVFNLICSIAPEEFHAPFGNDWCASTK